MSSNGPLYAMGGAHPHALDGYATGKREGKSAERKQEILTPQPVLDFVRAAFGGEEIFYDPCAAVDDQGEQLGLVNARAWTHAGSPISGLASSWIDSTYCNPPYKYLRDWLSKAVREADYGHRPRIIVLAPVRTHRPWYRSAVDEARKDGFVLELNPVTFLGYKQSFPAPLALLGFNVQNLSSEARNLALGLGDFL